MKSSRQVIYDILYRIEKDNAFSNLILDKFLSGSKLSTVEKSFVTALVYGVIERKITIDYQISLYLEKSISKLKIGVLTILRMGVYQLLFMEKVPDSAAVNESVILAKTNNCQYASGLINAVLRKVSANGLLLPDESDDNYLSVRYSCPPNLISMWKKAYGEENTVSLLEESLKKADICLRVNTLNTDVERLIKQLSDDGISAVKANGVNDALIITGMEGSIENSVSYKQGLFHVQDIASQLCVSALGSKENERIIDLCSAPGGKAFTIAENMKNTGEILAFDIYPSRTELIDKGAERLKITNITTCVNDATVYRDKIAKCDRILCDVPCSGLGVIRRKPEIKYKELDEYKSLPEIQYKILCNAEKYLKSGGRLVYSTCTLNKKENDKVCDKFLAEHTNYKVIRPIEIDSYGEKYYTLMPHITGSDGFFFAVFEKTGEK